MANLVLYRLMAVMIGCLLTFSGVAQLKLRVEPAGSESQPPVNIEGLKNSFRSRQELFNYLQTLPSVLQAKGYLSASVDSVAEKDTLIVAYLFLGRQYYWNELKIKPADRELLAELGYDKFSIADASVIASLPQNIVRYFENNGYPFAKVKWDSVSIQQDRLSASLSVERGPLYKLDSIGIYGSARISRFFFSHYLGLPDDGIYRKEVLDNIDKKLVELPYLIQTQPWSITMQPTGYVLNFYLQPKRSNQVDALIGFLPSNQQNNGKLLLTVDAKLLLQNAFGGGEIIDFNWEQIQPKSPRLHLAYQQPFVFRSRFGAALNFDLYKKDSSFLNINGSIGLLYNIRQHQSLKLLLQTQRTNLLDIDTNSIKFSRRLPDIVDMTSAGIGIEYAFVNTNYRFNPRRGNELSVTAFFNKKTIRKNNAITQIKDPAFNFNSLYDSVQLNSYQLKFSMAAAHYFPLAKRSVLKTAVNAGLLQTPDYFRNEMFQVGGYRLLRGFDEESIFTNRFAVATFEYRYITNLNSYFFSFADFGYTQFKTRLQSSAQGHIGLGAGMAFETKQGIFNISYAVGKRDDLPFNLRQSKIHLGYLSFF